MLPIARAFAPCVLALLFLAPLTGCDLAQGVLRCSRPEDCPAGTRCDAELGVCTRRAGPSPDADAGDAPPPRLRTDVLPPALNGAPYQVNLVAEDGTPPLRWSLVEVPPALAWLVLDESTGVLHGTPSAATDEPLPVQVRVVDAQERSAEGELLLRVDACNAGDRIQCTYSEGEACFVGESLCEQGRFAPCGTGVGSTLTSLCGEGCQGCGVTADSCVDGACRCGDEAACADGGSPSCCDSNCVDLAADEANCGSCGSSCFDSAPANTAPTCADGGCAYPCRAGYTMCDAPACTNTRTDWQNCGRCDNTCFTQSTRPAHTVVPANNSDVCAAGACVISCESGYGNCNDDLPKDGCETNTRTSVDYCGGCDKPACQERPNATRTCVGGQCGFSCNAPFENCNDAGVDGCEANLTSVATCGSCTNNCYPRANVAAMACENGGCKILTCVTGWRDCNGILDDGCEKFVMGDDRFNCGSCNKVCDSCSSGKCVNVCPGGTLSCTAPKVCGLCDRPRCNPDLQNCTEPCCM